MLNRDPKESAMNRYPRQPSGLLVPAQVQFAAPRAVHCKRERHHVYIGRPMPAPASPPPPHPTPSERCATRDKTRGGACLMVLGVRQARFQLSRRVSTHRRFTIVT
jgi:hypothetical protein